MQPDHHPGTATAPEPGSRPADAPPRNDRPRGSDTEGHREPSVTERNTSRTDEQQVRNMRFMDVSIHRCGPY